MQKTTAFAKGDLFPFLKLPEKKLMLFLMRWSVCCGALLLMSLHLLAFYDGSAQNIKEKKVLISTKGKTLKEALLALQDKSGFNVFFPAGSVEAYGKLDIPDESRSVEETLQLLLKGTTLAFRQESDRIIIYEKETYGYYPVQERKFIIGMVTDNKGEPIAGVTVRLKNNRNISTATDLNGHFKLDVDNEDESVIFSYVGLVTREIPVKGWTGERIVLTQEPGNLSEVVVIGYGISTRKELTGSVATVNAKTIADQPVGNVLNTLQGRMAGVQVTQSNGLPGSSVTIAIRGQNSLASGNLPLYIVDGVPFTFYNSAAVPATDNLNSFGTSGASGGISPFNSLNPNDIESISVLKDADATAIYGARGGNGVILITTKKGKKGRTKVDLNLSQGIGKVAHFIPMLSGDQYLALRKEAFANDNVTPTTTNAPDLTLWSQTNFTNWQKDLVGGTAHYSDEQVTLSGGSERTVFTFNTGYHRETTVYPGQQSEKRVASRLNVNHTSEDRKFNAVFSVTYSNDNTTLPSTDLAAYYNLMPNYNAHNADGSLYYFANVTNPYSYLQQPYKGVTTNFNANTQLRYTILPGLNLKASMGYATIDLNQVKKLPATSKNNATATQVSTANFADNISKSYIIEPQITYTKSIGKGKLDALAGTTFQENLAQGYSSTGTGYSNDILLGILSAASTVTTSTNYDLYHYTSLFGRLTYNWDGKYVLNGTLRRDGSSRFGDNNRFGTFGAAGAAWLFTNEHFVQKALPFLSYGKLRGSYGVTGNDQILNYQYLNTYATAGNTSAYQGVSIEYPSRLANPDIRWERTRKAEAALELGFFKDRVLLTTAWYHNLSDNQILYITTGAQTGFSSYLGNFPATIENKGLELELTTTNIQKEKFSWTTSLNITWAKTLLTKFKDLSTSSYYKYTYTVGAAPSAPHQYQFTGIDAATGKNNYKSASGAALPTYGVDQITASQGNPFYGGITNTFTLKQFELGFFIQFSHRNGYVNSLTSSNALGYMINQNASTINHWRKSGDATLFGAASQSASSAVYNSYSYYINSSTAYYGDASWLKLRNVNLAYSLPGRIAGKMKMDHLRIYAQGQNLWFTAKNKYVYDPETGTSMPALRTFVIGLNASF